MTITKVEKMDLNHRLLHFDDGTKRTVFAGNHELHNPQVGDTWPPEGYEHHKMTGELIRK